MSKPTNFSSLSEAIGVANYVEQMLSAEYSWINARVSWLFISQSFCITAYTILATSTGERFLGQRQLSIPILSLGLPFFGIICSVAVGVAGFAAIRVARSLSKERERIVRYINKNSPATIPLVGTEGDLKKSGWIYWAGESPHAILPWVLAIFWLSQMIR